MIEQRSYEIFSSWFRQTRHAHPGPRRCLALTPNPSDWTPGGLPDRKKVINLNISASSTFWVNSGIWCCPWIQRTWLVIPLVPCLVFHQIDIPPPTQVPSAHIQPAYWCLPRYYEAQKAHCLFAQMIITRLISHTTFLLNPFPCYITNSSFLSSSLFYKPLYVTFLCLLQQHPKCNK